MISIMLLIFLYFAVMSTPLAVLQPILILRNRHYLKAKPNPPVDGRRIMVVITTVGRACDVVNQIIQDLRSYNIPMLIYVLTEEYDNSHYDADVIKVPLTYVTPNHSGNKHRAQHYFSTWLREHGFGKETYVLHLDDDSFASRRLVEFILGMDGAAGQPPLRLRAYTHFKLATVAECQRVTDYASYVTFFNSRNRPVGVNGEGLTIRADVEAELGWDFGPIAAEDLLMGQRIFRAGYKFEHIPAPVYIAPATSASDFYKQRRRWVHHFWVSIHDIWKLRKLAVLWFAYLYAFGWMSSVGLLVWMISHFMGFNPPLPLLAVLTYNLVMSFATRQYGASFLHNRLYSLYAFLLHVPTVIFESGTFFYYYLHPPDSKIDFTIRKV